MKKALGNTRSSVNISSKEEETRIHCRISLLFNNSDIWIKKHGNKDFDVTMRSFHGAEICELVDFYILYVSTSKTERILMVFTEMMI